MISDFPLIQNLGVGLANKIPEDGDAQVVLPASIQPVVDTLSPHILVGTGITAIQSVASFVSLTKNNLGAGTQVIINLTPGYWELQVHLAARFDFVGTGATPHINVELLVGGNTFSMISLYAVVGAQSTNCRHRFLLLTTAVVRSLFQLTGVAETMDFQASVNAVKVL